MKKQYQSPKLHAVEISTEKSVSELATLTDDDLLRELKDSGYFTNKVYYQVSEQFIAREIMGETVLVPMGEQAQKLNGFVTFSETGQVLWNYLLKGKCTKLDLELALAKEYEKELEDVKTDVGNYLEKMMKNGLIMECH